MKGAKDLPTKALLLFRKVYLSQLVYTTVSDI